MKAVKPTQRLRRQNVAMARREFVELHIRPDPRAFLECLREAVPTLFLERVNDEQAAE